MDLQSVLVDGDLFVSYWTGGDLTVLFGTRRGITAAETRPAGNLTQLLAAFVTAMTEEAPLAPQVLPDLAAILVPPSLLRACEGARRLIVIPDASLNVVPVHLLFQPAAGKPFHELFPDGVLYTPSASAYVYACAKRRRSPPQRALILVGDDSDADLHAEAQRVKNVIPAEIITKKSELSKTEKVDLLYIATHGAAPALIGGGTGGARPAGWELSFDGGALGAEDFFGERIKLAPGSVVVLSACSAGHLIAGAAHELDGLIQSIFYAGASTILAARWPILYETADAVFARCVEAMARDGIAPARAFSDALRNAMQRPDLNALMTAPEWGAFALFGSGD